MTFFSNLHCKKFHGFHPLRKGFAADILSREGTDTLGIDPFYKGNENHQKVFIPFIKGINTKGISSLSRKNVRCKPFLKGSETFHQDYIAQGSHSLQKRRLNPQKNLLPTIGFPLPLRRLKQQKISPLPPIVSPLRPLFSNL